MGPRHSRRASSSFRRSRITISTAGADSWVDWYEDFVLNGNSGAAAEREGSIRFLAPNLTDDLARVDLKGLGIYRLTFDEDEERTADQVARLTARLYCEQMLLVPGGVP